jgi:hypothetical protein
VERGRVSTQLILSHLHYTDMSYKFKQTKELMAGDKGMYSETVPITGVVWLVSWFVGLAILVRQVVWSSFGKLSLGGSNLVPAWEDSQDNCPSVGGWLLQVAPVHGHKDDFSSVLFGSKVISKWL